MSAQCMQWLAIAARRPNVGLFVSHWGKADHETLVDLGPSIVRCRAQATWCPSVGLPFPQSPWLPDIRRSVSRLYNQSAVFPRSYLEGIERVQLFSR